MRSDAALTYPLAPNGIFATLQGEGYFIGTPMIFVRLAGCNVNCPKCDTDYSVAERSTIVDIVKRIDGIRTDCHRWVWITGGEPTIYELSPLIQSLRDSGWLIALATAGTKKVQMGSAWLGVDFLSVSPHDPNNWIQTAGNQLNIVPGLNGLSLTDPCLLDMLKRHEGNFSDRFVTPMIDDDGNPVGVDTCIRWVNSHPNWKLGIQAHKIWRLP